MDRPTALRKALWLEYLTVGWNVFEGFIAIGAGIVSGSIALVGFGLDSFIEVASAVALIWRLRKKSPEEETSAEKRALKIVAITFFLLAAYVAVESGKNLLYKEIPNASIVGIVLTALSAMLMPALAFAKRKVARELNSEALAADSTESFVCSLLSVIVLVGLALNALWGWWWADPVAGLLMVVFLIKEGREAWEGEGCGCEKGNV